MNPNNTVTGGPEGPMCPESLPGHTRARVTLTGPSRDYPAGRIEGLSGSAVTLVEGIIDQAILLLPDSGSPDPGRDMLLSVLIAAAGQERAQAVADDHEHVVMPSPARQNGLLRETLGMYDGTDVFSRWYEEQDPLVGPSGP